MLTSHISQLNSEFLVVCFSKQSLFEWSVESNQGLLWICLTPLYDWCKELAPLSQPIRCKPKANHDLDTRVFPRFGQFAWFYFEFSNLLIDCCDNFGFRFTTLNRKTLYETVIIYSQKLTSFRQQQPKINHLFREDICTFKNWLPNSFSSY